MTARKAPPYTSTIFKTFDNSLAFFEADKNADEAFRSREDKVFRPAVALLLAARILSKVLLKIEAFF
jgi:hypothetical protein